MDELISDYTMMKLLNYQYAAFNIPRSNADSIIVGLDGEKIVCHSVSETHFWSQYALHLYRVF